ncbi:Pleckstrin homology domain-containing family G member 1 [Plecturocebus cupreus]
MELSDSDRPISFGSTSSSASSRDSHSSFGSRMTLVSNSHLGLFNNQDKEAGAIKLELIPARPFSSSELQRDSPAAGPQSTDEDSERQPRAPWRVDSNGAPKTTADSATSPKLLYVDRVVQEILETERTYVQDLKSIVEHFGKPRWEDHLRSGIRDQPGQHGKTPSLLKIQKLAGRGGTPSLSTPVSSQLWLFHTLLLVIYFYTLDIFKKEYLNSSSISLEGSNRTQADEALLSSARGFQGCCLRQLDGQEGMETCTGEVSETDTDLMHIPFLQLLMRILSPAPNYKGGWEMQSSHVPKEGWSAVARSQLTATSVHLLGSSNSPASASQVTGTTALWEAEAGGSQGQEFQTNLANTGCCEPFRKPEVGAHEDGTCRAAQQQLTVNPELLKRLLLLSGFP